MSWWERFIHRRKRPRTNRAEATLEKWAARARLDEQQRRWPEIRRTVDRFTAEVDDALRRHP